MAKFGIVAQAGLPQVKELLAVIAADARRVDLEFAPGEKERREGRRSYNRQNCERVFVCHC